MNVHRLLPPILVAVLAGAPVRAARGAEGGVFLVGVGSTGSMAEASKTLKQAEKEMALLSPLLSFPAGFPKVLTSKDLPEIETGGHVVALGTCPQAAIEQEYEVLRVFFVEAWRQRLRAPPAVAECPTLHEGWRFEQSAFSEVKDLAFRGISAVRSSPSGAAPVGSLVILALRDARLVLVDSKALEFPSGCTASLATDDGVIRIEKTCTAPADPGTEVLRFAAVAGKIVPAPDASRLRDLQAVVFGAGTESVAEEALARAEKELRALPRELLAPPPGYPKLVKSDDLPGLAPGQHVVLLGLCPAERLAPAMKALRGFYPGLRAQKVTAASGEPGCPKVGETPVRDVVRGKSGGMELSVVSWAQPEGGQWSLAVYLRDASGALVDSRMEDALTTAGAEARCNVLGAVSVVKSAKGDRVRAKLDCVLFNTDTGQGYEAEATWSVVDGKIASRIRALSR